MIFLDLDDLLHIAERVMGTEPQIRDVGLLQSALGRPQASVLGEDAYPSIHDKAAALLQSVARNHGLVDGNERLALASAVAFYGVNGLELALSNQQAFELVTRVSGGELDDVDGIAFVLRRASRSHP